MHKNLEKKGYISPCKEYVIKKLPCGHEQEVDCGLLADVYYEKEGCSK